MHTRGLRSSAAVLRSETACKNGVEVGDESDYQNPQVGQLLRQKGALWPYGNGGSGLRKDEAEGRRRPNGILLHGVYRLPYRAQEPVARRENGLTAIW